VGYLRLLAQIGFRVGGTAGARYHTFVACILVRMSRLRTVGLGSAASSVLSREMVQVATCLNGQVRCVIRRELCKFHSACVLFHCKISGELSFHYDLRSASSTKLCETLIFATCSKSPVICEASRFTIDKSL